QGPLDNCKLQLGVPIHLAFDLDVTPIRPITDHLNRIERIQAEFDDAVLRASKLESPDEAPKLRASLRTLFTSAPVVQGTRFQKEIVGRWKAWETLTDKELTLKMRELGTERRKLLDAKAELETRGKPLAEDQQRRLEQLERELDLGGFEESLRRYEQRPWLKEPQPVRRQALQASLFR